MSRLNEARVMGIVNLTDDSFYAPSRSETPAKALRRIAEMRDQGADIIDLGPASSRPGARNPGPEEEWRRLEPVLKQLRDIPLSIDTFHAEVVRRAFETVGPFTVNDISAGAGDPQMLPLVGRLGLQYVAMHCRGTSATMDALTDYPEGVMAEIRAFFSRFSREARRRGIRDWILDPGIGFAKTRAQNFEILRGLGSLRAFRRPILVGVSRKRLIYKEFNISPEEALPATQVLHLYALQHGADILRVHDVAEARRTIALYRELSR